MPAFTDVASVPPAVSTKLFASSAAAAVWSVVQPSRYVPALTATLVPIEALEAGVALVIPVTVVAGPEAGYLPCPARRTTRSSPHPPGAQREPPPPDPVRSLASVRTGSPLRSRERRRPVVLADQHLCGQHKTNTTPCSGKDQHADNTDKTVLPGTRRLAC